jgi:hypothetical protein
MSSSPKAYCQITSIHAILSRMVLNLVEMLRRYGQLHDSKKEGPCKHTRTNARKVA